MDRGLDEIIADKRSNGPRNRRGGGDRRRERQERPRDGVRKSYRNDSRSIDSEWVHDRFEENDSRKGPSSRRRRDSPPSEQKGFKLKVENLHYDLTEEDLDELFKRIGPITRLQLRYDRAGRSEGVAYVTYEHKDDASEAVKQFDGANANGQPIRLTLLPSRNPFDTAVMPGRPLSERVSAPGGRSRSMSPHRRYDEDDAARRGIDRYVPGGRSRSKSPSRRRGGGRRPGARREITRTNGRDGKDAQRGGRGILRAKKTQEELDAEMEDYFVASKAPADVAVPTTANGEMTAAAIASAPAPVQVDDVDMIE